MEEYKVGDRIEIRRTCTMPSSYYGRQGVVTMIGAESIEVEFTNKLGDLQRLFLYPSELQKVPFKARTIELDGVRWVEYKRPDNIVNVEGVDYVPIQ